MIERGVILSPDNGAIDVGSLFIGGEVLDAGTFGLCGDGRVASTGRLDSGREASGNEKVQSITSRLEKLLTGSDNVSLDELENSLGKMLLENAIERSGGNLSAAARSLGITRSRLLYRLSSEKKGCSNEGSLAKA
jgi:DNA-binding NtrC family response regulator